ncbi:S8 family serine peptidase, partial [Mycolicibacterium obuense]|uniref:S8 family serine peptidase n=1 Tax=Mycolicibacterium obuense TaxID=1807 RepID=UPI0023F719BF
MSPVPASVRGASCVAASALLALAPALATAPSAAAVAPPTIDPAAVPPDNPPSPPEPMKQGAYCPRVGTLPGTDYRVQPRYLDMMNLSEAWQFGRGAGVTVAVIDTGVNPHPRLPNLIPGGDYVSDGDGLQDCDAHGTIVASIIGAAPADGKTPLPPQRQTRQPDSVPTSEAPERSPSVAVAAVAVPQRWGRCRVGGFGAAAA